MIMVNHDIMDESNQLNNFNANPIYDLHTKAFYNCPYTDLLEECNISGNFHTENSYIDLISRMTVNSFKCVNINIQSLNAKFDSLRCFIDRISSANIQIDCFCIQEIFVNDLSPFSIENYSLIGVPRSGGRGGGTCIYLHSSHTYTHLKDKRFFISNILETTVIKVNIKNRNKLILVSLYRPNTNLHLTNQQQIDSFLEHYTQMLDYLSSFNCPIKINGDFNLDIFQYANNVSISSFLDISANYGFIQIITKATRICNNSFSLIDNIFIKDVTPKLINSGVLIDGLSDHFMTFSCIKTDTERVKKSNSNSKTYRPLTENKKLEFLNALNSRSWLEILTLNCPNLACDLFCQIFNDLFEIFFPIKTCKLNKNHIPLNPFMSHGLLKSRKTKLKLARRLKSNPSNANKAYFRRYRNVYITTVKKAKKLYYRHKITSARKNSKKIWDTLKQALNLPRKNDKIGPILIDDQLVADDKIIANYFNDYFSNIGINIAREIPRTNLSFEEYLSPPNPNSMFVQPLSRLTLRNYFLSIKPTNSKDINGFSMKFLQFFADPLSIPLTHIFNLSIEHGTFPDRLKISRTIPIFKSGDKTDPNNFRGVSIADGFGKIFEKAMSVKLLNFLENNNFFYKNQFGFRAKFSTNQCVLAILNFISKSLDSKKFVLAVLLDVRKCFDVVSHQILLKKLENCGVRGIILQWFASYLSNRKQRVDVNDNLSDNICDILIGVLQGSILGVILFLIFINDLNNSCPELFNCIFADDDTSLLAEADLDTLISRANIELANLTNWYSANKLFINSKKTRAMLFQPTNTNLDLPITSESNYNLPIFINTNHFGESDISKIVPLRFVPNSDETSVRILGVLIDNKLKLTDHLNMVKTKVSRAIFSLSQMKHILDKKHLKLLYSCYLRSHIDYCCNILCLCTRTSLEPLILAQKKAIRIISGANFRDHTAPLFKHENILPLLKTIDFNIYLFMHRYDRGNLPEAFRDTWRRNNHLHDHLTRNSNNFYNEGARSMTLMKHPLFYFPHLFNSLPNAFKSIEPEKEFKRKVFKMLLDSV